MARTVDLGLKYTSVILDHMFHQTAFFSRLFCFAITYNVLFFAITFFVLLSLCIFIVATCHWALVTVNNFSFPLLFSHCFLCCFWYFFLNSFRIFEGEQVEDMILLSSEKFLIAHFFSTSFSNSLNSSFTSLFVSYISFSISSLFLQVNKLTRSYYFCGKKNLKTNLLISKTWHPGKTFAFSVIH